jgi:REase_DpnII-MboI
MVPVSAPLATSLAQLLEQLNELIVTEAAWPSPDTGFAAHVFARLGRDPPAPVQAAFSAAIASPNAIPELRMAEAPVLAAEGFALTIDAAEPRRRRWGESALRLTERDPFPPDRASFFYRPVELLGIALGARACADAEPGISRWLSQTIEAGRAKLVDGVWSHTMTALAQTALEPDMTQTCVGTDADVAELALLHWVAETDPATADALGVAAPAELERELLEHTALAPLHVGDVARAALISAALVTATERTLTSHHQDRWQLDRSKRDTIALLQTLCRRFPQFARELGHRHGNRPGFEIKDEYDVQDALRALLRLHFDDVRPEENVPSYGGSRTRLDFLLKRERTVIETKMTRDGLGQRRLVEELTNDKAHYRGHPDCDALVCFIYDPRGRVDNPAALEIDLASIDAGLTTTVIVAPTVVGNVALT